jgi:hypothetical protein
LNARDERETHLSEMLAGMALAAALAGPAEPVWVAVGALCAAWPRLFDAAFPALGQGRLLRIVPDPLRPDWEETARALAVAVGRAAGGDGPVAVALHPVWRGSGQILPYEIDFDAQRGCLAVRPDGGDADEAPLSVCPRVDCDLPLRVEDATVRLIVSGGAAGRAVVTAALPRRAAGSLALAGVAAAAAAAFSGRLAVLIAAAAALQAALSGDRRNLWWPWSRRAAEDPARLAAAPPQNAVRLVAWVALLWLTRYATAGTPAAAWLDDPLRLLLYGAGVPVLAVRAHRWMRRQLRALVLRALAARRDGVP